VVDGDGTVLVVACVREGVLGLLACGCIVVGVGRLMLGMVVVGLLLLVVGETEVGLVTVVMLVEVMVGAERVVIGGCIGMGDTVDVLGLTVVMVVVVLAD